jgi:hypothetical protein
MEARGLGKLLRQFSFINRLKLYRLWFFRMWEDRVLVLVPLMLILQQALSVRNVPTLKQNKVIICFVSVRYICTLQCKTLLRDTGISFWK